MRIRIKAKKKTKNEDRAWQRSPRYWVAMGTLAAYTTVSGSKLALAYGQEKGGGYYAYVSSKFANIMEILDLDPNGTGHPNDAKLVGLAYEGWVERAPHNEINDQLTCKQRHPLNFAKACK